MATLEGGDMKKAMERLRVPPMKEHIQKDSNIHAILISLGGFSDAKSLIGALSQPKRHENCNQSEIGLEIFI